MRELKRTIPKGAADAGLERFTITPMDRAMLPYVLRGTWVFPQTINPDRLRAAVDVLLRHYPFLSGRLKKRHIVEFHRGAPFIVAEDLSIGTADVDGRTNGAWFSKSLSPFSIGRGWSPLFAVKLTQIKDSSVLGITCSHVCLDGAAFYQMAHTLSCIATDRPFEPPVLSRATLPHVPNADNRQAVLNKAKIMGWVSLSFGTLLKILGLHAMGWFKKRVGPFHLSPQEIQRLKDTVKEETGLDVSSNIAISAYFTRLLLTLRPLPKDTQCHQVTVLDGRTRLAGLSSTFAGNAAFAVLSARFCLDVSFGELCRQIQATLAPYVEASSSMLMNEWNLANQLLAHRCFHLPFDIAALYDSPPRLIYVNNFRKFPIYDLDFGTAEQPNRPVRVLPHLLPDPLLIWPSGNDGGVDAYVTGTLAHLYQKAPAEHPLKQQT